MSGEHYFDTITRVRAPLITGAYNASTRDWDNATRLADLPCAVEPISSTEDVVTQQRTITRWRVHALPESGFLATDRAEWDDGTAGSDTFEIEGDVGGFKKRGVPHHIQFVLKRVQQE